MFSRCRRLIFRSPAQSLTKLLLHAAENDKEAINDARAEPMRALLQGLARPDHCLPAAASNRGLGCHDFLNGSILARVVFEKPSGEGQTNCHNYLSPISSSGLRPRTDKQQVPQRASGGLVGGNSWTSGGPFFNGPFLRGRANGGRVVVDRKPTEKQKAVGNYKKHHMRLHGLDVTIESRPA
jgi:hypothetical protein